MLLHIVFYSTIGEEQGTFDLCDVANALCDKLIYRHPHVYGEAVAGFCWGCRGALGGTEAAREGRE